MSGRGKGRLEGEAGRSDAHFQQHCHFSNVNVGGQREEFQKETFTEMLDWKCCFSEATGHSRNVLDFVGEDVHRWNCAHPQVSVAETSLVTVVFNCALGFFHPHYP